MSVLMRRENTLIIEPGSDISKIQIINFILLPNSKKHFEGPPLYTENSFRILLTPEQQILSYKLKYQELMKIEQYRSEYLKYIDAKSQIIFDLWYNFYKHLTEEEKDYYTYYFQSFNPDYIGEFYKSNCQGVINDNYIKVRKDENSISLFKINQRFRQQASDM
ncbi:Hypothetical_protein [Hexamita inflata]|uniref:Hypothetical_protein n=1 Tax=Hexamita inflata TaxID=28002 RepID=A0AA86P3K7_9EUKA|nr:Hypothetical protein HINF_LOCUS18305 [Hexamita inflata]